MLMNIFTLNSYSNPRTKKNKKYGNTDVPHIKIKTVDGQKNL